MAKRTAPKSKAFEVLKVRPAELTPMTEGFELDCTEVLDPDALGITTDEVGGALEMVIGIVTFV